MEPPVSEPSVTTAMPDATAAADPPEEPPGTRVKSRGLCTGLYAEFSLDEPIANSSQFILPSTTAPAASMRATAVESYGGMKFRSEEHTSELQSRGQLVCRLLLEKKNSQRPRLQGKRMRNKHRSHQPRLR